MYTEFKKKIVMSQNLKILLLLLSLFLCINLIICLYCNDTIIQFIKGVISLILIILYNISIIYIINAETIDDWF